MKILNVNISLDAKIGGGTAERTYQLSRFLVKHGFDCTALVINLGPTNIDDNSRAQGVKVYALPCLFKRFYIPWVSWKKLTFLVAQADVVHLINYWTLLNALVYLAARKTKTPYVLCPAGALPAYGRSRYIKKIYQWLIGNSIIKNASGHIAITQDEASFFERTGIEKQKIVCVPNGIEDLSTTEPSDFLVKHELINTPYILFLGRLNSIKGPDLLLSAFAELMPLLKKYHLVFAGPDGGMLEQLKQTMNLHNLQDKIHFIGYVAEGEKFQAYNNATLLVIPSRQEAMSLVVLEAGILGKPVLMTDKCGFPELADKAGGMVVPASSEGLATGLKKLLLGSVDLAEMGKNLQRHVKKNYTWDMQVTKLIRFYQGILL